FFVFTSTDALASVGSTWKSGRFGKKSCVVPLSSLPPIEWTTTLLISDMGRLRRGAAPGTTIRGRTRDREPFPGGIGRPAPGLDPRFGPAPGPRESPAGGAPGPETPPPRRVSHGLPG